MTVEILYAGCQEMEHLCKVHTHMPEGHIRNIPPALSKKGLWR
ncbi:hypothetical protein [Thermococcus sp. JdF3]|nr:hypothetical protein [Thermococcus sp. JdF3]